MSNILSFMQPVKYIYILFQVFTTTFILSVFSNYVVLRPFRNVLTKHKQSEQDYSEQIMHAYFGSINYFFFFILFKVTV